MAIQHQFGLVYQDLRRLRKDVQDLESMLSSDVTARRLLHDLDEFEESLGALVLESFDPYSRDASTTP